MRGQPLDIPFRSNNSMLYALLPQRGNLLKEVDLLMSYMA